MATSLFWRLARELARQYVAQPAERACISLPHETWQRAELLARGIVLAEERGWNTAARNCRQTFSTELEQLIRRLHDLRARIGFERVPQDPTLRLLYEELIAIDREFSEMSYEDRVLSVTTGPVILEGINLGRFIIRLDLDRLPSVWYHVTALEPRPAATCSDTTHPHVHDERLCAGEGRAALAAALPEGRLFDFFTIVERILHTYSPGSAYVELKQWHGTPCRDCDDVVAPNDARSCRSCERTLCEDCLTACELCEHGYCSGCLLTCAECETRCCLACRRHVANSRYLSAICNRCTEESTDAEIEAPASPEADPTAEPELTLHADRLGEAPLSA